MRYAEPQVKAVFIPEHREMRVVIHVPGYSPAEIANIVAESAYFKPVPRI